MLFQWPEVPEWLLIPTDFSTQYNGDAVITCTGVLFSEILNVCVKIQNNAINFTASPENICLVNNIIYPNKNFRYAKCD